MKNIFRMHELVEILNKASYAYYQKDNPIMTDYEYDKLYDELTKLENETGITLAGSPTQRVQGFLLDGFKKVTHSKPMLSAAKTKDIKDIEKFLGNYDWYCSGKLDGITLVTIYEDGKFVRGITRGNGLVGEDVTEACRFIKNLPMQIPYKERLELRGECVMEWDEFNRINENLAEKYSHPRNLAAGTIRQLDLNVVRERNLSYVVFECVTDIYDSKLQELHWLGDIGFETVTRMGSDVGSAEEVAELMTKEVQNDKYPYDGLIFEVDSNKISKSLGKTGHHESCRLALKWSDEEYTTVLRDVEWQVGKTGILSPVAVFDEVDLDGALTSRATLHNITYIKNLELGIGDEITLIRSNMVIPRVVDNLTRSNTLELPDKCPVCGSPTKVIKDNDSEVLICTNDNCPGRLLGLWKHFVSRKAMNIDGLSEQTLKLLLTKEFIAEPFVTIYELEDYKTELYKLPGFGKKSIDNLLVAIEKSKQNVDMVNFITAFSIPGIGEGQSKIIAKKFPTFDEFMRACGDGFRFDSLDGIGEILNRNIHKWWFNNNWQMIDVGNLLTFKQPEIMNKPEGSFPLVGKTFVVTGSVHHFKNRDELKAKIEELGGKNSGSVSKNTNYLINNDVTSTSGKNAKAKELGIPIISEEDFLKMIDD